MSALDIFVIVLLAGGAVIGFVRGLVHELFSLLAWVVGIVMLRLFHTPVSASLTDAVGTSTAAAVLAFVLLFSTVVAYLVQAHKRHLRARVGQASEPCCIIRGPA